MTHEDITSEQTIEEHLDGKKVLGESPGYLTHEKPTPTANEVPNSGFVAWFHVAGAFCIFLNTW